MTKQRLQLGRLGEDLAVEEIESLGYECIARNYRCPIGEIDLVAKDGDTLVFVEIKTRKGGSLQEAKEAVDAKKRRKISQVALFYMKSNDCCDVRARFDVVAVSLNRGKREIEVIRDAFERAC